MTTFNVGRGEERLWKLIAERCKDDADLERIDQKVWDLFGEKWAIMFTDLAGFSRGVKEFGIIHFLQVIHEHHTLVAPVIEENDGFLLKAEGDSLLAVFRRPQSALRCAVEMQRACQRINQRRKPEEQILLCVGLGYGDVLRIGEHEVFGAEVNAASKLGEDTASANEILLTRSVTEACADFASIRFEKIEREVPGTDQVFQAHYL